MGDAYRCDHCGEYCDGEPVETLYVKNHIDRQGIDDRIRAELCADCSESFAGGPPEERFDD